MPSWQARLLNAYIRTFVRRESWGPDPESVAQRARKTFGAPPAYRRWVSHGLKVTGVNDAEVSGEWVSTESPDSGIVLYIHGGGFVSCSPGTHISVTAALAKLSRWRIFSMDYRLAPEHSFPAGLDDVVSAYKWLLAQGHDPKSIAVAGDSAGGGLVLSLLVRLRAEGVAMPACAVCLSAWTDLSSASESVRSNNGKCHMFRPGNNEQFAAGYLNGVPMDDPLASPIYADLSGLPPVLLQVGSTELLLDDSRRLQRRIAESGGVCEIQIFDDVAHGWHLAVGLVPEADQALRKVSDFIRRHSFDHEPERTDAAGAQIAPCRDLLQFPRAKSSQDRQQAVLRHERRDPKGEAE
jgi:epsilon-lactone hydrolase